jgi:hypothetical protein
MVDPVIDSDDEDYDFSEGLKYYTETLTRAYQRLEGDSDTIGQDTSLGIASEAPSPSDPMRSSASDTLGYSAPGTGTPAGRSVCTTSSGAIASETARLPARIRPTAPNSGQVSILHRGQRSQRRVLSSHAQGPPRIIYYHERCFACLPEDQMIVLLNVHVNDYNPQGAVNGRKICSRCNKVIKTANVYDHFQSHNWYDAVSTGTIDPNELD